MVAFNGKVQRRGQALQAGGLHVAGDAREVDEVGAQQQRRVQQRRELALRVAAPCVTAAEVKGCEESGD
jgi:hypothetical protein